MWGGWRCLTKYCFIWVRHSFYFGESPISFQRGLLSQVLGIYPLISCHFKNMQNIGDDEIISKYRYLTSGWDNGRIDCGILNFIFMGI